MDDVSDAAIDRAPSAPREPLTRGMKAAITVAVVVVLAVSAGGASAYTGQAVQQNAIAARAAVAERTAVSTKLSLAEDSAVKTEAALTALASSAQGVADPGRIAALTSAVVALKDETDKPTFPESAPVSALKDRSVDLDAAVTAALATVPAVGESVKTVSTARLAAAGSASAASTSAAKAALGALGSYLAHHEDPRGLIIPTIATVKAAQVSHDSAVAAAAAAAQAAARAAHHSSGGSFSAGPGAPICASDVLTCVNQIRAYYGLHSLSSNGSLNATAQACAERMAASGQMTHSTYPGGWSIWGENIAEGYGSSVSVFNAWMASPGHRANILRPTFTQMGIGHVSAGAWWCEQFGG